MTEDNVYNCSVRHDDTLTITPYVGVRANQIVLVAWNSSERVNTTIYLTLESLRELADELTDLADELEGEEEEQCLRAFT